MHPKFSSFGRLESDRILPISLALQPNRLLDGRKERYLALVEPNAMEMDG